MQSYLLYSYLNFLKYQALFTSYCDYLLFLRGANESEMARRCRECRMWPKWVFRPSSGLSLSLPHSLLDDSLFVSVFVSVGVSVCLFLLVFFFFWLFVSLFLFVCLVCLSVCLYLSLCLFYVYTCLYLFISSFTFSCLETLHLGVSPEKVCFTLLTFLCYIIRGRMKEMDSALM